MTGSGLTASIVIACYTLDRWTQLGAAVESALHQSLPAEEVVVVVDHNPELEQKVTQQWPSVRVLANQYGQGASGARNTGAFAVQSAIVAFLDDDAVADRRWLETLLDNFDDPTVVGVGGGVVAAWETRQPAWFPNEFAWVVGVSYPGLPETVAEIRNVWAENMAVRRDRFLEVDGFRLNFGKVGTHSSPEDTDLCIRMAGNGGRWLYVPSAQIAHHVPAGRSTFQFFLRRCYSEGAGKAALAGLTSSSNLHSERDYTRHILPQAVARDVRDAMVQKRLTPLAQAAAILLGLASAGAGYARQALTRAR